MTVAPPGSPLPLTSEVVSHAVNLLRMHDPQVAALFERCRVYAQRGCSRGRWNGVFFLPLAVTLVAPDEVLEELAEPEFLARIRQAIDAALIPPAVVSELTARSELAVEYAA
jgi:hypothetical protein